MFTLLVFAGDYTYAVDTQYVVEVIPQVKMIPIPHAPDYIHGHINFEGTAVPVVDLSLLVNGTRCSFCMHTRIVLLQPSGAKAATFGLLAEKVTDVLDMDRAGFLDTGVSSSDLPFFEGISHKTGSAIELLNVDKLNAFLRFGAAS